ncbi:RAD51-associated protein 1 [Dunckerocampus dactyliophorus]|uniref:RAD51-associated protein 1 n=1 Tax=Dunckerocampus dactyliophorus TaxID=161453 RepID=UPI0024060B7F|nr:RAD51-associated protein 1 [Dunckerocampus dactyliophorus]
MERPSRKTKTVNYCESRDFDDDDDDFASVKPPPSKKPKEGLKQQQHKKPSSQESNSRSPSQRQKVDRKPLDEKLLARDLEAAITLSLLNNPDGVPAEVADENTDPASLPPRLHPVQDEDDDYQPKLTPDSESDNASSEAAESEDDEELAVKKPKKKKTSNDEKTRKRPVSEKEPPKLKPQPRTAAPSSPARSPPTLKLATKRPTLTASVSKPAVSMSPTGGRIPKWNPPGQIGKSPSSSQSPPMRSPGQGLRLGLSRLVRVKPLHPSIATT